MDVDFVRKAVCAIGRCAISIEIAAERCVDVLLELIQTRVNYVVQEAIIVIKDIFRRYPNQYEGVIGTLCDSLDTLDEPEAKAAMVWIIGEYAERIDNSEELLEAFLDTFHEETAEVQQQLLTATVKLFLKRPVSGPQSLIQNVLLQASTETDDPDLRDRAYMYWRLLSTNPEAAKDVVLTSKPMIRYDKSLLGAEMLLELTRQISTLSSVYYKLPASFAPFSETTTSSYLVRVHDQNAEGGIHTDCQERHAASLQTFDKSVSSFNNNCVKENGDKVSCSGALDDLMQNISVKEHVYSSTAAASRIAGLSSTSKNADLPVVNSISPARSLQLAPSLVLPAEKGAGLEIYAVVVRGEDCALYYDIIFTNRTLIVLGGFQLQLNKNTFSLKPLCQPQNTPVAPGESFRCMLPLSCTGQSTCGTITSTIQVAVMSPQQNNSVFYFIDHVPLESILLPSCQMDANAFSTEWDSIMEQHEHSKLVSVSKVSSDPGTVGCAFGDLGWQVVSNNPSSSAECEVLWLSGKVLSPLHEHLLLIKMTILTGSQGVNVTFRSQVEGFADMVYSMIDRVLSNSH